MPRSPTNTGVLVIAGSTPTSAVTDIADLVATLSSQSPVQGSQISVATVTDGGNDVLATATYQWMVDTGSGFQNATGTGATTATYSPTEADEGGTLEVVVTHHRTPATPGGKETTTVTATNAIADSADLVATLSSQSPVQGSQISVATVTDGGTDVLDTAASQWKVERRAVVCRTRPGQVPPLRPTRRRRPTRAARWRWSSPLLHGCWQSWQHRFDNGHRNQFGRRQRRACLRR